MDAAAFSAQAIPLLGYSKAWSPNLGKQPLEADVLHVDIKKGEDFEKFRGKLKGKIVFYGSPLEVEPRFEPLATQRSDASLRALENSDGVGSTNRPSTNSALATPAQRAALAFLTRRCQFFTEEGVAVLL